MTYSLRDWIAGCFQRINVFRPRGPRLEAAGSTAALPEPVEPTPSFSQTPDTPQSFGFKIMWFALKASDPAAVVEAFELGEVTPANWESGLAAVYSGGRSESDDRWLFVSPPVRGWVLAASTSLPYPTVETHHDIGSKFDALFLV
jgi:hypothetical protein